MIPFEVLYERLLTVHGSQSWWPAESAFEIMVGALLVQRTTWRSASTAVQVMRRAGLIDPMRLAQTPGAVLEPHVRGAGFYRMKAMRLRKMAQFVVEQGGIEALRTRPTASLRQSLLDLDGVGPETADAILLYAFDRPAVVVDGYLRRLSRRLLGGPVPPPTDSDLRRWVADEIPDARSLNEFHALVVAHGKADCVKQPLCNRCQVRDLCRTGSEAL